jgi:hypothetical protein
MILMKSVLLHLLDIEALEQSDILATDHRNGLCQVMDFHHTRILKQNTQWSLRLHIENVIEASVVGAAANRGS